MNIRVRKNLLSVEDLKLFRKLLRKAFTKLRDKGFFARQNFARCPTCGWDAVPKGIDTVAFYHEQDSRDIPYGHVYICWDGDGRGIADTFKNAGLKVQWDGDQWKRILVKYPQEK